MQSIPPGTYDILRERTHALYSAVQFRIFFWLNLINSMKIRFYSTYRHFDYTVFLR